MAEVPAAPSWPSGIAIRTFVPGEDEHAVYEASEEAFADTWDHVREDFGEYEAYFQSETFDPSLTLLAVAGKEVAGVALGQRREERRLESDRETAVAIGWIESLSVRQPYRRRGVALALLRHAFGEFYRRGVLRVGLFVDAESETGAVELYLAAGMRPVREWIEYEKLL
jgi:ribosomal protein S18 acetylase RimI-like enzyme